MAISAPSLLQAILRSPHYTARSWVAWLSGAKRPDDRLLAAPYFNARARAAGLSLKRRRISCRRLLSRRARNSLGCSAAPGLASTAARRQRSPATPVLIARQPGGERDRVRSRSCERIVLGNGEAEAGSEADATNQAIDLDPNRYCDIRFTTASPAQSASAHRSDAILLAADDLDDRERAPPFRDRQAATAGRSRHFISNHLNELLDREQLTG